MQVIHLPRTFLETHFRYFCCAGVSLRLHQTCLVSSSTLIVYAALVDYSSSTLHSDQLNLEFTSYLVTSDHTRTRTCTVT